jgi:predicted NBD/HSP70 family sugar kinase
MDHYYTYASVDVPFKEIVEKEFNLPTLIENDATAACFGEHWLDLQCSFKNMLYMFSGVGCGIMVNGEIYGGNNGYAGEVSIYNYKEQDAFNCELGGSCFLKRWEIDLGIVGDIKKRLNADPQEADKFFKLTASNVNNVDLRSVFIAARAKNALAAEVLDAAARRLGIKTAFLVNLFNPQMVIIGGGLEEAGEEFLNKVILTVKDWAFREVTEDLKIFYSQLRENAVALGAASLVMQKTFAQL